MLENILIGLSIWNLLVGLVYGLDKWLAIKQAWRISEFTLLFLAFAFAGAGALVAMAIFHHKTRKWKFRILVPLALLWETFSIGYVVSYWV